MNNNNNKKSLKTIKKLREELAGLMMEKELDKITVSELAQKADIHRTTFYSHFQDIYDLYETAEKEIMGELDEMIMTNHKSGDKEYFKKTIGYIKDNPNICRMIFSSKYAGPLRKKLNDFIEALCKEAWSDVSGIAADKTKFEYLFRYHIHGCMSVIEKWVENDFHESEQFIIKTISQIEANARTFIFSEISNKK